MSSANPSSSDDAGPAFTVSCDPERLDVPWIVHSILGSYWGGALSAGQIRQALAGSLCFGAYLPLHPAQNYSLAGNLGLPPPPVHGQQIGFVRVVTDSSIFSSVCDVFVEESHRGKGVGTALMTAAMEHPAVKGTLCILRAKPAAQLWYFKNWDFHLMDRQHGLMQRVPR